MLVYVDFDNIAPQLRIKGLIYVTEKIITLYLMNNTPTEKRILFRFYGGWYTNETLTVKAQDLSAEIARDFPRTFEYDAKKYIVNAELAFSLLNIPALHIIHTYRQKKLPHGLTCISDQDHECLIPNCPLISMRKFINKGKCPVENCPTKIEDVLFKNEQKLIDTMLTTDIIISAMEQREEIVLVTSDDDFIPPVMAILSKGVNVTQIHTKREKTTPHFYNLSFRGKYIEANIFNL